MSNTEFNQAAAPEANFLPSVVEQTKNGERGYDLFSRLMKDNVIMVQGPVNSGMASIIVGQLLFLGSTLADKPADQKVITMNIDSPGGSVDAGMSIYDTMNFVQAEYGVAIRTIGLGMNMSMGSFLLCAGTPGHRFILPNSDHMIHQPSAGSQGKVTDMAITQDLVDELKQRLALLYVAHTKMDYETVKSLSKHDTFLRAEECVKLGVVDKVLYADEQLAAKQGQVEYAPGVEAHLKRISEFHRATNHSAMAGRKTADEERGPHTALIATLGQQPKAPSAP